MAREYQNGDGFGYILSFRKLDGPSWTTLRVPHVESSRYVHHNQSLAPYSPFEVKIKAYNRRGDGPFSQIAVVHSAEEGGWADLVTDAHHECIWRGFPTSNHEQQAKRVRRFSTAVFALTTRGRPQL